MKKIMLICAMCLMVTLTFGQKAFVTKRVIESMGTTLKSESYTDVLVNFDIARGLIYFNKLIGTYTVAYSIIDDTYDPKMAKYVGYSPNHRKVQITITKDQMWVVDYEGSEEAIGYYFTLIDFKPKF